MKIEFNTNLILRLDEFLRENLPEKISNLQGDRPLSVATNNISNSKIRRLILSGNVFVNDRECRRPAFELRGKSKVVVEFDLEKFFYEKQPDDIQFSVTDNDVLFEDENLIFINKPAFFPVEQTITGNRANLHDAVVDYLWKRNPSLRNPPYVGIMHRLDKETSGVILFTKNRTINKAVSDMFQSHNFTKKYIAIVTVNEKELEKYKPGTKFTVEKYMGRITGKSKEGKWGLVSEKDGGQYSKTDFEILEKKTLAEILGKNNLKQWGQTPKICGANGKQWGQTPKQRGQTPKFNEQNLESRGQTCLIVSCSLYTGRTHQIRVHLSESGLPLLGDELYGGKPANRIYLHACQLACDNEDLKFDVRSSFQIE